MKLLTCLALLATLASCATKILLTTTDYNLKDQARFTIQFLKDKSSKMDIGVLALSTKEDVIVIKKEEVGCGKGAEKGMISKFVRIEAEPFILISKSNFKDFVIVCENTNFKNVTGNVYVEIKNIYALKDGAAGDVLASDIKIELK